MAKKSVDTEQIRKNNRNDVIETLRVFGPKARIELCQITQLSPATVTAITADLIKQGRLLELESTTKSSARGRPKVVVDLNASAEYVIGIKISINEFRLVLGDYKGDIIDQEVYSIPTTTLSYRDFLSTILEIFNNYVAKQEWDISKISALGIAFQGVVDSMRGELVWSPALSIKNSPISAPLHEELNIPIIIANDANCIAVNIMQAPEYRDLNNFVVIMLGYGVGMGMIIDGKLYSGFHGAGSEFGHTTYNIDGPQCQCGKKGCIEAYVGDYALYREAQSLLDIPKTNSLHPTDEQMELLYQKARDKDPDALKIFQEAGKVLGVGITNIMALLGPEKVVISGKGIQAFDFMQPGLQEGLHISLLDNLFSDSQIITHPWDQDVSGSGIIGLSLKALYHQ